MVEEALRIYTINAAYASFEERIKGSIEPGKLADLVVLSDDLQKIESSRIKDVKVEMTITGGKIVNQPCGMSHDCLDYYWWWFKVWWMTAGCEGPDCTVYFHTSCGC